MSIKRWAWLSSLATAAPLVVAGLLPPGYLEAASASERFARRDFASDGRLAADAGGTGAVCTDEHQPGTRVTALRPHMVNPDALFDDTRRELMAESARIWLANGVSVQWVDGGHRVAGETATSSTDEADPTLIDVTIVGGVPAPNPVLRLPPLAAILFTDGAPTTRVSVYPTVAEQLLADVRLDDRPLAQRPVALQRGMMGLMLGRAVAHELGHYLFRSREHAQAGLMRAMLRTDELVGLDERPFRVVPPQVAACDLVARQWRGSPDVSTTEMSQR